MIKIVCFIVTAILAFNSCQFEQTGKTSSEHSPEFIETPEKTKADEVFSKIYINGSDAGTYFQTLFKLNKFDEMIRHTSIESLRKHGYAAVYHYYRHQMRFAYDLGKLLTVIENPENTMTLIYLSNVMATEVKTEITIVYEDDMIKVMLPDTLDNFPVVK